MTEAVFTTLERVYAESVDRSGTQVCKIVHGVNPFLVTLDSEHGRAQSVSLLTMKEARRVAGVLNPELRVVFAKVILEDDVPTVGFDADYTAQLTRSILDLGNFVRQRPLPLIMDILRSIPAEGDDVVVFTNVDIAVVPGFYSFIAALFERGFDCAIVNRRTIGNAYMGMAAGDRALMACEAGRPHPGFDCFAMRTVLRNRLFDYNGCVGIGGVMLPLVHQLLALAERPIILLDAHATYHLGDDQTWLDPVLSDYMEHNRREIDAVFDRLLATDDTRVKLLRRLANAHQGWVFPERLRLRAGWPSPVQPNKKHWSRSLIRRVWR